MNTKDWSKHAYSFNCQDAIDYGTEEAILLNSIRQWLTFNKTENKNIFDGYAWTYGTGEYYTKYLPFWNGRKISRLLKSLVNKGALIKGNHNKKGYDRTIWYTSPIDGKVDETSTGLENTHSPDLVNGFTNSGESHLPDLVNASAKSGKPIPFNKTINKTVNKHKEIPDFVDQQLFDSYFAWRKKAKLSVSQTVHNRIVNKLNEIEASQPGAANEALGKAEANGWKDIYPPNNQKMNTVNNGSNFRSVSNTDRIDEMLARREKTANSAKYGAPVNPFDDFSQGVTIDG